MSGRYDIHVHSAPFIEIIDHGQTKREGKKGETLRERKNRQKIILVFLFVRLDSRLNHSTTQ